MIMQPHVQNLADVATALKDLARFLESIMTAGLARAPADVDLVETVQMCRSNAPVGTLTLTLNWIDQESDIVPTWEITLPDQRYEAKSLSALLRVFSTKAILPDRPDELNRLLKLPAGE